MSLQQRATPHGKTASELRAIARDYRARGLDTLARSWEQTAQRQDAVEQKAKRR